MNISESYSATYTPFGGAQKTWTNTYDPKLKYSGKEREGYSDLDYFGARYYDHNSYRFISVDPIINKEEALTNPQLWNLYAYCRNNPITYLDPDGRDIIKIEVYHKSASVKFYSDTGKIYISPAALGDSSTPTHPPGTTLYVKGIYENPTSPKWQNADKPWNQQKNPDNPFGPYIILLQTPEGKNARKHIHGTTGGWGKKGSTKYLGGSDPKGRKWTHGCIRIPNADIREIYKEGVKKNAPVKYK